MLVVGRVLGRCDLLDGVTKDCSESLVADDGQPVYGRYIFNGFGCLTIKSFMMVEHVLLLTSCINVQLLHFGILEDLLTHGLQLGLSEVGSLT